MMERGLKRRPRTTLNHTISPQMPACSTMLGADFTAIRTLPTHQTWGRGRCRVELGVQFNSMVWPLWDAFFIVSFNNTCASWLPVERFTAPHNSCYTNPIEHVKHAISIASLSLRDEPSWYCVACRTHRLLQNTVCSGGRREPKTQEGLHRVRLKGHGQNFPHIPRKKTKNKHGSHVQGHITLEPPNAAKVPYGKISREHPLRRTITCCDSIALSAITAQSAAS